MDEFCKFFSFLLAAIFLPMNYIIFFSSKHMCQILFQVIFSHVQFLEMYKCTLNK